MQVLLDAFDDAPPDELLQARAKLAIEVAAARMPDQHLQRARVDVCPSCQVERAAEIVGLVVAQLGATCADRCRTAP